MIKKSIYIFALLFSVGEVYSGPSFDCSLASTSIEHSICSSPELSQLDVELSDLYVEFLNNADPDHKDQARKIQRSWLLNRNFACTEEASKKVGFLEGRHPDFEDKIFMSIEECLHQYYSESISAFKKGLILSKLWLSHLPEGTTVTLPGIQNLYLEFFTEGPKKPEHRFGAWYITNGTEYVKLLEVTREVGNPSSQDELRFVNVYMDALGQQFASTEILKVHNGTRADCWQVIQYQQQFWADLQSVSRPISVDSKVRTTLPHCFWGTDLVDWRVESGELFFVRKVDLLDMPRNNTQGKFYKYSEYKIVDGALEFVRDVAFSDYYPGQLKPLEDIADNLEARLVKPASDDQCEAIINGMRTAWGYYFHEDLKGTSYLHWIDSIRHYGELSEFQSTAAFQAALVYRDHLYSILSEDGWQLKLREAGRKLEGIRSNRGVYQHPEYKTPFEEEGFTSLHSCPTEYNEGFWVSQSIYSFWYRRQIDGSLGFFKELLDLI